MTDKLYHIRIQIYYTNSHSYNAGCEDGYVVAKSEDEAYKIGKEHFQNYFDKNNIKKKPVNLVFCTEMPNYIQEIKKPLTRNILFEKK